MFKKLKENKGWKVVGKKKGGTKSVRNTRQGRVMAGFIGQGKGLGLCSKCEEKL